MKTNLVKRNPILPLLAALLVLLGAATKVQAATTYTFTGNTSGAWNVNNNWSPSTGFPVAGDTAIIPTGKAVTSLGGIQACATLTIQGTGGLIIDSSSTLNVSGVFTLGNGSSLPNLTNNGTLNLNGTGASFILNAGTLTNTAGSTFTCAGGGSGNSSVSPIFGNNGTATFTGSTTPFNMSSHNDIVINGPNGILNLNNSVAEFANSATLTATAVGNTVNYGYAGAQNAGSQSGTVSYYNLTLSGSGAKALAYNAPVNGTLTLQGTATATTQSAVYGTGATLVYNGSSSQTATSYEFPSSSGPANLTINNPSGVNIPTSFARTVNGTLTLANGTFTLNSVLTLGNGANIIRTAGSLSTAPTFTTAVNVTYNNTASTTTGPEIPTSSTVLNNLTINNTAGVVLNANAKVNGAFAATYNGSTVPLAAGANTLTFASSPVNITVSGSTLAATTYTIVSSSSTTVSGALGTLTVSGAGAPYSPTPTASDSSGQLILTILSAGPTPVITGAATTTAFTTTYGTASANQSFAVSGVNLTANLVATAGTGFEVATSSGGTYGSSVSFTPSSGSASGTVYVRLAATAAVSGIYNSVNAVVLSSTGAISQNITTPSSGSSVTKTTPTVTVTVGSYTYTGSAQGPNTVTFSTPADTGTVTWSYVGTGSTTYGPSSTLPTNVGTYTATATVAADSNNNSASSSATAFSIATATPTVTVNVGSYFYSGSPQGPNTVTISTTDTGAVTWSYVGTGATTYGPSSTLPSALGTYTAMALVAADSNNNSASSSATAFSIITATPTAYTFNVTSGAWNSSANWTPTGVPGQSSGDTATIPTGDTVTGLGGTTVSITNLTIGGTGSLNIDSSSTLNVSGTFTMGNSSSGVANLTNNGTLNLTGTGNIFVMATGSATGAVLTNTAGSTFTCAGGCQSGNANAVWTFGNNGTATFTGSTSPFNTGFHNAAVINGPNGVLNLNNSVAAFGNSGTLTATAVGNTVNYGYAGAQSVATQTGTATYYNLTLSGSGSKTGSATVNGTLSLQGTATCGNTITYGTGATLAYAGSAQQTSSANELPSGGVPNLTINNASGVLLGGNSSVSSTLTLTAGILNLNGHTLSAATVTRTSGSIVLTPTVTLNNKVYDGTTSATTIATRSLAGTLTGDGNVTLGTSGSVSAFSSANVGSYTPSVTSLALSGTTAANYSLSTTSVSPSANITKATPTVVVANYNVTYNGNAHSASVTSITGVNGETGGTVGTVTLPASQTAAGIYSDSWSFTGTANYNNISSTPITDTIGKATASVTVTPYSVTYDGSAHTATAGTVTGVNGETGATVGTVILTGTTHTAAGTYSSDSWSLTGGANYNNIAAQTITDTIGKATPSVTVTPYSVTYDGNAHTATAGTVTGVNGETGATVGTVVLTGTTHTAAGTYASDSWSLTGAANYSNISATTITDTITQATPSFSSLSSLTNSYGVASITLTGTVSAAGSLYPASGEMVSATINSVAVTGTVTDGTGDFSITYNDPSLATLGTNVYPITYNYAGNSNLAAATADTSTSLTITNALLTITANNDSKCYGDTKTYGAGSTAFTSSGLVNGETIGTVTITASDSPSGTGATDPAGNYDLTPSAATGGTFDANNYLINYNNGTLTVNPLPTHLGHHGAEQRRAAFNRHLFGGEHSGIDLQLDGALGRDVHWRDGHLDQRDLRFDQWQRLGDGNQFLGLHRHAAESLCHRKFLHGSDDCGRD